MKLLITSIVDLKRVTHNRIHVLVDYLSRRHEVTVLCLNAWWLEKGRAKKGGTRYHRDPYFEEMFERARMLYLSQRRVPPVLQEWTCLRKLGRLLDEIDCASYDVHVNYGNLIAGCLVTRRAKRFGIPTVFDIADDLPQGFQRSPQVPYVVRPLAGLVARSMLGVNVKLARRVTFVTQALKDAYQLPDDKAVLMPNGVHQQLFRHIPARSVRHELGIDHSFVVGFVGALLDWVDLEPAYKALKTASNRHPDVRLLVVGGGEKLQESVELANRYGIADRVIFTNHVPLSEVPQYISSMDVCLICRRTTTDSDHSLPLKLFEYMACEKPVVSVPLTGVREAVGDRVLFAGDSDELADRITDLYCDERLRDEMGMRGRRFVEHNYSWAHICRRFEEVLAEAAFQATPEVSP